MQRREAKIGLRDRKVSPETERAERYQRNPHRNGLFRGGTGICGLARTGWWWKQSPANQSLPRPRELTGQIRESHPSRDPLGHINPAPQAFRLEIPMRRAREFHNSPMGICVGLARKLFGCERTGASIWLAGLDCSGVPCSRRDAVSAVAVLDFFVWKDYFGVA